MEQIFKTTNHNKNYMISNWGNVINCHRMTFLKPVLASKDSYLRVNIDGKLYSVHRLVAIAFLSNKENKKFVNHKDGNKMNNNVSNLEWCTSEENEKHASENGLKSWGEGRHNNIMTAKNIPEVLRLRKNGMSYAKIAYIFNISKHSIFSICSGRNWRNVTIKNKLLKENQDGSYSIA